MAYRHTALAYMRAVQAVLSGQQADSKLDQADYAVVMAGHAMDVGPYDCAAQIIANRADARGEV